MSRAFFGFFIVFLCNGTLTYGQYLAPNRSYSIPHQPWGGCVVEECIPYQPSVLFTPPGRSEAPVMLDELIAPQQGPVVIEALDNTNQGVLAGVNPQQSSLPPGVRAGVFQKLQFSGTWIPQLEDDSLGIIDGEAGVVFGLPFPRPMTPLLITPRFAIHSFDGPVVPDLPGQVYDAELEFRHLRRFGEGPWAMSAAVTLGQYSDFDSGDADAFRITGQAFGVYERVPGKKWVFGIVYLNRPGLRVIPAAGLMWQPWPDLKIDAILPRPRIAWRLPGFTEGQEDERWVYLGGEFGGGVWSIRRPLSGTQDLLTYNDYRIVAGYERKIIGGMSRRFEAGYIFGRELEFASATPDVTLDDSFFLRVGLQY